MSKPVYRLIMRRGPTPGTTFELSKHDMTIGRDLGNDYVINDVEISRKHLRLVQQGENFVIEDLGSTNGSFVNGQRLTGPHVLIPGDLISLGEHVTLVVESAAYDPAATRLSAAAGPTVVAGQSPAPARPAAQQPAAQPEQQPAARPAAHVQQPVQSTPAWDTEPPAQYAGQVPQGPEDEAADEWESPRKKPINPWILAGGGCILIVICFLIALLIFIDQPWSDTGLYCTTPFDIIFRFFGYCP